MQTDTHLPAARKSLLCYFAAMYHLKWTRTSVDKMFQVCARKNYNYSHACQLPLAHETYFVSGYKFNNV